MSSVFPKLKPNPKLFEWVMTCYACPVQFDIYHKGEKIAYFRYRHGILTIYNYEGEEIGDDLIYYNDNVNCTSYLDQEELDEIVPIVEQKISEYAVH